MDIERRRALPGGRAVVGGVLMALSAIGVFLAHQQATRRDTDPVVVSAASIRAGEVIEADDLRTVEAELGDVGAPTFAAVGDVVGRVALAPIAEGEILQAGALTTEQAAAPAHEVALVLPRTQLAVGRLRPGERVDVYATDDVGTSVVAQGAEVVDLDAGDAGSLTNEREISLVVAVPGAQQVAALVHALRTGDVTVVRSTFARAAR